MVKRPRDLADRMAARRKLDDGYLRETFTLPREGARAKARDHQLLIITKANSRATVHRSTYLDYIGIKTFDETGEVTGERRFLGLFTSAAYTESVLRVPIIKEKIALVLERSGFTVSKILTLNDHELSFSGPARPEVLDAWRTRLDRMKLLRDFCGTSFEQVREEFLGCLMRADHRSVARVYCCIANKGDQR